MGGLGITQDLGLLKARKFSRETHTGKTQLGIQSGVRQLLSYNDLSSPTQKSGLHQIGRALAKEVILKQPVVMCAVIVLQMGT